MSEAMEFLMTYGLAILSAIIVIGTFWFFLSNPPPEEFVIYKEECYTDVTIKDLAFYNRDLARINNLEIKAISIISKVTLEERSLTEKERLEYNFYIDEAKLSRRLFSDESRYETEICEQVEVDYMTEFEYYDKDTVDRKWLDKNVECIADLSPEGKVPCWVWKLGNYTIERVKNE